MLRESNFLRCAAYCRAFNKHIACRSVKIRQRAGSEIEDVAREPSNSRAKLDQPERIRATHSLPHFAELASEQAAENGMNVNARVVVRKSLRFGPAVIAVLGMAETGLHVIRKRNWA